MEVRNLQVKNLSEALAEIRGIGAAEAGCRLMAPKAVHYVLKVSGLTPVQANILKQEMLARGGEAAIAWGALDGTVKESDALLMGTARQYELLAGKLEVQPFGLRQLAEKIREVLANLEGRPVRRLACREKELVLGGRTLVMGILNVTPDSFSDGGLFYEPERAVEHALQMVEEGADIIDIGGESTRPGVLPPEPGYDPVPPEEELRRILPVLEKLLLKKIPVPVSVDTTKAEVARRALEAGAHIINDQRALRGDPAMAEVAAAYGVPVILMHNRRGTDYTDMVGEIVRYFRESMEIAERAGVDREKIIIDPGFGFGKTVEQNLEVLRRLGELACLGKPVLVGTSRKSMIGKTLNLPPDQRVEGTAATVALAVAGGADIVRVHDVKEMVRVVRMADAVVRRRPA
ncbi:MAG: dihydropteroate synthase [Desulfotomaculales bacterium]